MNHEKTTTPVIYQKTRFLTHFTYRTETSISLILLCLTLGICLFQVVLLIAYYESMIPTVSISVVSFVASLLLYGSIVIEHNA